MFLRRIFLPAVALGLIGSCVVAMQRGRRGSGDDRGGVPEWDRPVGLERDVFSFARVRYSDGGGGRYSGGYGQYGYGRGNRWAIDFPDSDLNFSLRLHQLTSLKVNPDYTIVDLDDPKILDYPFVYLIEPGAMYLSAPEVEGFRKYCMNGGFVMVDDFWGNYQWDNFYSQIKRVFPNREFVDLPITHEIFQIVYPFKEFPQVPAYDPRGQWRYISYEPRHGGGEETPHYRAIMDDNDRIMLLACHNTDLGDAWEQEGMHPDYFEKYSVKQAYPMGINIVTYALTH